MGLVVVKAFFIKYLLAPLMIALLALVLGILKKKTNYKNVEYPKRFRFPSKASVKESCFLSVIKNSSTLA